jgi:hypothetical protein
MTNIKYVRESSNLSKNNDNMMAHYYRCRLCQVHFDNLADRQRHELTDHIQKGEIP